MNRKEEYSGIDLFKFVMSIVVVAIHTLPFYGFTNRIVQSNFNAAIMFAVPFFFTSSGFLLMRKATNLEIDLIEVICRYLKKIISLYCIWTLLYLPITIVHFVRSGASAYECILDFLQGFFLIGEQYNSWPLWYLLSTIYALAFFIVLMRLKVKVSFICSICVVFYLAITIIDTDLIWSNVIPGLVRELLMCIKKLFWYSRFFQGGAFISLGMMLSRKKISKSWSIVLLAISYISLVLMSGRNSFVLVETNAIALLIGTICLFSLILLIRIPNDRICRLLRGMSTTVYFIHMYVWTVYYLVIYGSKTYGMDSFVVVSVFSALIGYLFYIFKTNKQNKIYKEAL